MRGELEEMSGGREKKMFHCNSISHFILLKRRLVEGTIIQLQVLLTKLNITHKLSSRHDIFQSSLGKANSYEAALENDVCFCEHHQANSKIFVAFRRAHPDPISLENLHVLDYHADAHSSFSRPRQQWPSKQHTNA